MEGGEHLLDLLAAPSRALGPQARRQTPRHRGERGVDVGAVRDQHIDAVDATQPIEGQLRRGDVHQHEAAVHDAGRALVLEQAANHEGLHAIAGQQPDLAAQ